MFKRVLLLSAALLLSGCDAEAVTGSSVDGTYIWSSETEAMILRLASKPDDTLTGNIGMAQIKYGEGRIETDSKMISGREANGELFLTIEPSSIADEEMPLTGEVSGSDIIIRKPGGTVALTLERGDQAEYEERVKVLYTNLNATDAGLLTEDDW